MIGRYGGLGGKLLCFRVILAMESLRSKVKMIRAKLYQKGSSILLALFGSM